MVDVVILLGALMWAIVFGMVVWQSVIKPRVKKQKEDQAAKDQHWHTTWKAS